MASEANPKEPAPGQVIVTTTTPAPSIDVVDAVRKRAAPSPTDRIEARADLHITELKADKERLSAELQVVRSVEISHLREDARWLEARETALLNALATLQTSYEWAISFNWFSFALIAIGGCVVSYAAFLPPPRTPDQIGIQKIVATSALVLLLVGVIVQAFVSYRGQKALTSLAKIAEPLRRPAPNPRIREAPPAPDE